MYVYTVRKVTCVCETCVFCVQDKGYDKQLKEILNAEILPLADEFDQKLNDGS